jgi:hypothetical protein
MRMLSAMRRSIVLQRVANSVTGRAAGAYTGGMLRPYDRTSPVTQTATFGLG